MWEVFVCFIILGSSHVTILIATSGLGNSIIVLPTLTSSVCPLKYKWLVIHEMEKTNKKSIYSISQEFVNSGEKAAQTVREFSIQLHILRCSSTSYYQKLLPKGKASSSLVLAIATQMSQLRGFIKDFPWLFSTRINI